MKMQNQSQDGESKNLSTDDLLRSLDAGMKENQADLSALDSISETETEPPATDPQPAEHAPAEPEQEMKIEDLMRRYMPEEDQRFATPKELKVPDSEEMFFTDEDFDAILGTTANIPAIREQSEPEDADTDPDDDLADLSLDELISEVENEDQPRKKGGFFASLMRRLHRGDREQAEDRVATDETLDEQFALAGMQDPLELTENIPANSGDYVDGAAFDDGKNDTVDSAASATFTMPSITAMNEQTGSFVSGMTAELSLDGDGADGAAQEQRASAEWDSDSDSDAVVGQIGDGEEFDETDAKLMVAFGMDDELAETIGIDRANELGESMERSAEPQKPKKKFTFFQKEEAQKEEYVDPSQTKEIFAEYRRSYYSVLLRLCGCVLLLLFTFFLENCNFFGTALHAEAFPAVHVLVDLQALVLGCALIYRSLLRGLRDLFKGKPGPESMTLVLIVITAVYHVFAVIWGSTELRMYNFPVILCIGLNLLYEYLNTKREIFTLNIIASKRPKYVAQRIDAEEAELETEGFRDCLPQNPTIFRVRKTNFVDHFRARNEQKTKFRSVISVILPAAMIASLLFFILGWVVSKSFTTGWITSYQTLLLVMPFTVFLTWALPLCKASKEAYGVHGALVGEEAVTEYNGASAISFEDKEVFPSYGVKVKSVKVYGESRIDRVLYNLASVFSVIGGPLAGVLENTTRDMGHSEQVEIEEIRENGLCAVVDGCRLHVGKAAYLYDIGVPPVVDADDAAAEQDPESCIMYLVSEGEVSAKVYVQYVMDPDFEFVVRQMYKIGVCVGIKTFDPNIDDEMISANIRTGKFPVRILKCNSADQAQTTSDHMDSGVVSKTGAKSLLQTLSLCDRIVNAIKTNIAVKVFSMVLGLVLMGILMAFGVVGSVASVYLALYQIFWIVPTVAITRILIGRL